jgi:CRP-like cAMP-binding protein
VELVTVELLSQSELFRPLDEAALTVLYAKCRSISARRNHVLFEEGDQAHDLYIVKSGRVAIAKQAPGGRESVVALMEEGDLFGELSLFDDEGRSAGARALEPSELLSVPYDAIREVLQSNPALLWNVVSLLSRRLRTTGAALADSVFLDVTGRTAKRLLELAGEAEEFSLPITQEELAGMVGASRERVNKAIATFVRLGWLEQFDRKYRILDRAQLELRAR